MSRETPAKPSRRVFWVDLAWMLASIGLWAASFHPLNLWPLSWIALVPWMVRSCADLGARRFGLQWVIGQFFLHVCLLAWVGTVAPPLVFAVPVLGVPFSWLTGRAIWWTRTRSGGSPALTDPLIIVLVEVLRDTCLDGLTWGSLGYPQAGWTDLIQLASLGRVHLIGLVVVTVNSLVAQAWIRWRARASVGERRWVRPVILAGVVIAAAQILGMAIRPREFEPGPLVAGLQPNIPQIERLDPAAVPVDPKDPVAVAAEQRRRRLESHRRLYRHMDNMAALMAEAGGARPDMIVWPETSFSPSILEPDETLDRRLTQVLLEPDSGKPPIPFERMVLHGDGQVTLLGLIRGARLGPGVVGRDDDRNGIVERNVAWVVRGGKPTGEVYAKRLLCPFGEYVPLPAGMAGHDGLLQLVKDVAGYIPDLTGGAETMVFDVPGPAGPVRASPTICFEIVFPRFFRESVRAGADFHVNMSNDAWFDGSAELELVDVAAIFRAVETGRSLFRVSNSGVSTLIAPDGVRMAVVEDAAGRRTQVRGVLLGRIPVSHRMTAVVRFGDSVWLGATALLMFLVWRGRIRAT